MIHTENIFALEHARHPLALLQDWFKLIYQSEFGAEHLVTDREKCLAYILSELEEDKNTSLPVFEDIGGGIRRINLSAAVGSGITAGEICDGFMRAAQITTGTEEGFRKKCLVLASSGYFPEEEVTEALEKYIAAGLPPMHHTEVYRAAYSPHYRLDI